MKGKDPTLNSPVSPASLWLKRAKLCWLLRAEQGKASLDFSLTTPRPPEAMSGLQDPLSVGLYVKLVLGLSLKPNPQPCSMSSFCPNWENEKMVCEFLFHSVKIRTEKKIHLCKSVFFQLLFAHILYNYGQQEGIFHSHTGSIFHTKVYAGGQPALELFTCVVDRKSSNLWPVRPQKNVLIWTSPVTKHIILISPPTLVPLP